MNEQQVNDFLKQNTLVVQATSTYEEFCDNTGALGRVLKGYRWVPPMWELFKNRGIFLSRPLVLPTVTKIAEIFKGVVLVEVEKQRRGQGLYFIGSSACGFYGGTRSVRDGNVKVHNGAKWYGTYGRYVHHPQYLAFGGGELGSFELIHRADGILVTAKDDHSIGSRWVALLPHDQGIEKCLSDADIRFLKDERQKEWEAYGHLPHFDQSERG